MAALVHGPGAFYGFMGRRTDRSKYLWLRREPSIVMLAIKMKKKPSVLGHDIICEWTNLFRTFSHT